MDQLDLIPFLGDIARQYRLDPAHTHGLKHWARVLENGLRLAEIEGGDITVISLFSIFHDACRHNQVLDPGHGARGAALAERILTGHPMVSSKQITTLAKACRDHTNGSTKADLTVQICWDADRLDLARAGIMPKRRRLCTASAKDRSLIEWANKRALNDYSPPYVDKEWFPNFIID